MDHGDDGNSDDNEVNDVDDNHNINYEEIEEELDLHFPVIGDVLGEIEQGAAEAPRGVPNGFHDDDEVIDDSSDDDFNDEEIPIQPRIMLGGVMAVLGHQQRVDDSNSDDDHEDNDDHDEEENEENREVKDVKGFSAIERFIKNKSNFDWHLESYQLFVKSATI